MLTDHNIVLTIVVAGFSVVVNQLPEAVSTLVLNLPCCDLKQFGQGLILLGGSQIAALRRLSTEGGS
jgi:hypothetical protein